VRGEVTAGSHFRGLAAYDAKVVRKNQSVAKAEGGADRGSRAAAYPIDSVSKAVHTLLLLKDQRSLRVADVAVHLDVARSTAHRILTTLQAEGMLRQETGTRTYSAGHELIELGMRLIGLVDLRSEARPILESLVDETSETAQLVVLDGAEIIFAEGVEGKHAIRAGLRTGVRAPAHASAAGKALLAQLSAAELQIRYGGTRLTGGTERAVSTRLELQRELQATRVRGYATNFSESEPDLTAVSVVVRGLNGVPRAALSVSAPAVRIAPDDVPRLAKIIQRAAEDLGRRIP
jgi:IclR family transcriptional regulator, acetate operon repressor